MKTIKALWGICLVCAMGLCCLPSCAAKTVSPANPSAEVMMGDADGDGAVTAGDARLVLRASVGLEPADPAVMDADADGEVSAADARLVLRYSVGLEAALPVNSGTAEPEPPTAEKTLVVYFSRTGHTRPLAEYAAEILSADLYEITALVPYTDEDIRYYTDCRADREQNDPSARPAIAGPLPDVSGYGAVLLGYPIWHGQAPKILYTFLESVDLTGKTIVPFCTSASSPIGSSDANLHPLAPGADWKEGRRFAIGTEKDEIARWLTESGLTGAEQKEETTLQMTVNETELTVVWEDNEAVAALAALAPLTVQLSPYGGFEQVGPLGTDLPSHDVSTTTEAGDIVLYNGNQIVVFYGRNSWSYTRLGKIQGLDRTALTALLGNGPVTLTLSPG